MRFGQQTARRKASLTRYVVMGVLYAWLLASCGSAPRLPMPGAELTPIFLPPTIAVPATPSPVPVGTRPGVASGCSDRLVFIADLTIPDGSVVEPNSTLDKRWEVENTGTCNWGEGYYLKLSSGPAMGIDEQQPLFPARSGTRAIIRLIMTAPEKPGAYRSAWQAYNPENEKFGEVFFIDIVVK